MAPCRSAALATVFAACLLSAAAGAAAASGPPASSELAVLQTIRVGLDPAGTVLSSWQRTQPCSAWRGLTCDSLGHVTSINFGPSAIFSGTLVSAIGSLSYLTTLVVRTDGFRANSTIPTSISKLSKLKTLMLSGFNRAAFVNYTDYYVPFNDGDGLSGLLPAGIAALPALTYLDLSNNSLADSLPSFAGAKLLAHLDLSGNGFSGPAPVFPASNALTYMNLANNCFNGTGTLTVLKKLEYLNLGSNILPDFEGVDITSTSLTYLNVSFNVLQGPLPDVAHVKSLQILDLSYNLNLNGGFTGPLPADYGNLTSLRVLNLFQDSDFSSLQGVIPAAYGALSNLTALSVSAPHSNASVDEVFPLSLGKLHKLQSLTIGARVLADIFTGILDPSPRLPTFVGSLTGLRELTAYDFGRSEAMGAFPPNLANLTSLTSLTLGPLNGYESNLYGSLPKFVLSLKSLQKLDLSRNSFSGRVWPNLRVLTRLDYIDLSFNSLSGTVADVLSAGPSWRHVDLGQCGLNGSLPAAIGGLKNLQYLSVGPGIVGTLPASMSQLTELQDLSINNNNLFTGTVPDLSATKLTVLSLDGNNFTGALPKLPTTLQTLSTGPNSFNAVPDIFTGLNQLASVDLRDTGPAIPSLPASLFRLPKLLRLVASGLGLKSIPTNITAAVLNILDLSNNSIAQPLPAGIGSLHNLNSLDLSDNLFTGPVPDLSAVPLSCLSLSNNSLTGSLPKFGRGTPAGARLYIDLALNKFTGGVSSAYLASFVPQYFGVAQNQLTGPLPAIPATLLAEVGMNFSHNAFSGTLPADYFNRANLSFVDISYNQLSGPVPDIHNVEGFYPAMEVFYPGFISYNYFTGRPVYNSSAGGAGVMCIAPYFAPYIGDANTTSYNCLTFAGTNCTVTRQRTAAQCAAFCGDTSASGPCAGHGTCSLKGGVPTCACDPGYKAPSQNGATCVRATGHHPPGHGHHPPGQGHHPPGQGHHSPAPAARRLMQ